MTTRGMVKSSAVWAMLDDCAPGWSRKATRHNVRIMFDDKTYPAFPIGSHGKTRGKNFDVQLGHVRHLVRLFKIEKCASAHFPWLRPSKDSDVP